jgi:uncharacterized protein YlxW (UPF0749 family)
MISCCEVALCLGITNVVSLAIFAGYTVHLRLRQIKLEKKNGAEQHQIDELKKEINQLQKKLADQK